jgi:hypothetical protein
MKCLLCTGIVSRYQRDPFGPIPPLPLGHCANDSLCLFIRDVISGLPAAAGSSGFCRDIGACVPPKPANLVGISCGICLALASRILTHEPDAREAAFDYFCRSWKHATLVVCGAMLDEGLANVLGDLMEVNSSLDYCLAAHFCKKTADGGHNEKPRGKKKSGDL